MLTNTLHFVTFSVLNQDYVLNLILTLAKIWTVMIVSNTYSFSAAIQATFKTKGEGKRPCVDDYWSNWFTQQSFCLSWLSWGSRRRNRVKLFSSETVFCLFNFNCQLDMVLLVWSGVKYRALLFTFLWFHRICPTFSPSFQKKLI